MENLQIVLQATSFIPKGKVLTYKDLAMLAGVTNPRVVGNILHLNKDPEKFPCHRVVNQEGKLADNYGLGGAKKQKQRLIEEGVKVTDGKVEINNYLWQPNRVLVLYFKLLTKFRLV